MPIHHNASEVDVHDALKSLPGVKEVTVLRSVSIADCSDGLCAVNPSPGTTSSVLLSTFSLIFILGDAESGGALLKAVYLLSLTYNDIVLFHFIVPVLLSHH